MEEIAERKEVSREIIKRINKINREPYVGCGQDIDILERMLAMENSALKILHREFGTVC